MYSRLQGKIFLFLYEGETNCKSGAGVGSACTMFLNGRTYPRSNDVDQINIANYSRANNVDPESSYPFLKVVFDLECLYHIP